MAGSLRVLIPLFACVAATAFAKDDPCKGESDEPRKRSKGEKNRPFDGTPSPEFDTVRKALEALTPEQRKRFQENFWRWANLPPEEKKALRERDEIRRKVMREEQEAALKETGLPLEGERKEDFFKRYAQERRRIEEQLREEMGGKRKPLVRELVTRLRAEFATPVESPAPAKPQP